MKFYVGGYDLKTITTAYICGLVGAIVNIVSHWWVNRSMMWLMANPPEQAVPPPSGGAVGAVFLLTFILMPLSWIPLIYAGILHKESESEK